MLGALLTGLALAAVVQGVAAGALWLLVAGITLLCAILTAIGKAAELQARGFASGLRAQGPRAYAPALVNSARAVHKESGMPVVDGRSVKSVFVFDLTVVPEERAPFRVRVAHPLDLQGLLGGGRAVVEYDPRQPWRVVLPADPPREWRARAAALTLLEKTPGEPVAARFPAGAQVLGLGLLFGAAFFGVGRTFL